MYYRKHWIETDGSRYRVYRRFFIFKLYLIPGFSIWEAVVRDSRTKFSSLKAACEAIDAKFDKPKEPRWHLVDPMDKIKEW